MMNYNIREIVDTLPERIEKNAHSPERFMTTINARLLTLATEDNNTIGRVMDSYITGLTERGLYPKDGLSWSVVKDLDEFVKSGKYDTYTVIYAFLDGMYNG